jgi:RNase H
VCLKETPFIKQELNNLMAQNNGTRTMLRWVPGHEGNSGNKRADQEAKNAAQEQSSPRNKLPKQLRHTLPKNRAAVIQWHEAQLQKEGAELFRRSPRAHKLQEIDPLMPLKHFEKMMRDLPHRQATILIQLRTGHVPWNKHLFKIGKANSPLCPGCRKEETVHHYLIQCKKYKTARVRMEAKIKRGARSIWTLLSNPLAVPALFQFISETGRLKETKVDFKLMEDEIVRWKEVRKERCKGRGNRK